MLLLAKETPNSKVDRLILTGQKYFFPKANQVICDVTAGAWGKKF